MFCRMAATYQWAPDGSRMRVAQMAPWNGGLVLPLWPKTGPSIWTFNNGVLASGVFSTGSSCGYGAADTDGASGAWLAQYAGSLVHYTSGAVETAYAMPSGQAYTGLVYSPVYGQPYVVAANGQIYEGSGLAHVGAFPASAWFLATSGTTLFTLTSGGLGRFNLTSVSGGASGLSNFAPLVEGTCLAASSSASAVAVGGWTNAVILSGYSAMAFNPLSPVAVGVNPAVSGVDLYLGAGEAWALVQSVTGVTAPGYATWSPNGTTVYVSDRTNGTLTNFSYALGSIRKLGSIAVAGAQAVSVTPDNAWALVAQSTNFVTPVALAGSGMVSGAAIGVTSPGAVLALSPTQAALGYSAGLRYLNLSGGAWLLGSTVALPFVPNSFVAASGVLFAAGTAGGSGYLYAVSGTSIVFSYNWAGAASGLVYEQGQLIVNDPVTPQLRSFGNLFAQYQSIFSKPPTQAFSNIYVSPYTPYSNGGTLFGLGASGVSLYTFNAPFDVEPLRSGGVVTFGPAASSFTALGSGHVPTALTFGPSGVYAATLQNDLYVIASGGGVLQQQGIAQFTGQPQTTPLGISSLVFVGSGLYASSSLSGPLIKVV